MRIKAAVLAFVMLLLGLTMSAAASEPVTAKIPVLCRMGEASGEYIYTIEAEEADAPMPPKSTLSLKNTERGEFVIACDTPDTWHYQIRQTKPEPPAGEEAGRPYSVILFVGSREDGTLYVESTCYRTGGSFKAEECAFVKEETDPGKPDPEAPGSVVFEKVNVGNSKAPLPGATLRLVDPDGNEIERWTSTEETKEIKNLKINVEYRVCEVEIPSGYEMEPNGEMTFMIGTDGSAVVTNETGEKKEDGTIMILNGPVGSDWEAYYPERYKDVAGANKERETEAESRKKKKKKKGVAGENETEAGQNAALASVRTGDETPLMAWTILMAAALAGILVMAAQLRRRKRR